MEQDIREQFLRLLQVCKIYQVRAFSLNHALTKIAQLPPNKRAALTMAQIEELVAEKRDDASLIANGLAARVEEALSKDKEALDWIKNYPGAVENSSLSRYLK